MRAETVASIGGRGHSPASTDLDAIASLNREACRTLWLRRFGHVPPRHISVQLMRKALAHEAQVDRFGGHSSDVRRALQAALKIEHKGAGGTTSRRPPTRLRPGVHLVREWNGRSYQVEVLDEGFRLDGKSYRSLTAIAHKITGAHWSGPRFFGVG